MAPIAIDPATTTIVKDAVQKVVHRTVMVIDADSPVKLPKDIYWGLAFIFVLLFVLVVMVGSGKESPKERKARIESDKIKLEDVRANTAALEANTAARKAYKDTPNMPSSLPPCYSAAPFGTCVG
ncbi:hypothetical protein BT63DRAFT_461455 [Microthyrium microscopicum]|uniref:Uncharacterized protein n=1 Tax=Microthyrium microscopicum TaxID=703497 RepID=A0A6A6TV69_9PEZI|nr:hypothetical protein BT63DRAFT_461455 [Microthyrium microscopicum]